MKNNTFLTIQSFKRTRSFWMMLSLLLLLFLGGCVSNSYNSQRNWHRTPASTGRNRCGCLLNPATDHALKLYQQTTYALPA